jgi:hypothetical protein
MRALFFGPSGHGKTTLLGSAQNDPRTAPMLLFDFEGGSESLSGLDIDVIQIRDWTDYNEGYDFLKNGTHSYRSVGLDSISETHIFALLNILSAETSQGRKGHPDLLQQGDYGIALVQMRRLIREFRDLTVGKEQRPIHSFFTSLATEELDAREGMVKKPALAGAFRDEGPGLMSVVGYLALTEDEEGNPLRSLLLKNIPRVRTKIRTQWLAPSVPDFIDNPTITALLDVLNFPKP